MSLTSVPGFQVGHAQLPDGGSGCTVVLGPFRGVVEVRGMATGSRELGVLSPFHLVGGVDAVLLSGGSAFGLGAAQGVMHWLEEKGQGFDTGVARVPLVPAGVIFDLAPGRGRPGPDEGRRACEAASVEPVPEGRVGAGTGATVGKVLGPEFSVAGGVGSASRECLGHGVGALAVVNALGDVLDGEGGILAGARREGGGFLGTDEHLLSGAGPGGFGGMGGETPAEESRGSPQPGTNTTLVVVGTDLPLDRVELGRVARMAAGALSRAISPVNTPFDGDLVFSLSSGTETREFSPGDILALGVAAREVTETAIRRAVVEGER